uniref:fibroblast growth factor receptor-like 1 n=1 Tax=Styela clava TaxID=7725 RepID=UPI0019393BAD|nr:fibroblast growth factor receptor-like 1 [Styela clava]
MNAANCLEGRRELDAFKCAETTCQIVRRFSMDPWDKYGRHPVNKCSSFRSNRTSKNMDYFISSGVSKNNILTKTKLLPSAACLYREDAFISKFRRKMPKLSTTAWSSFLCFLFCFMICEAKVSLKGGPPRLTGESKVKLSAVIGEAVVLPCTIEADSPPLISWKLNGEEILGLRNRFKILKSGLNLRIRDVRISDAGTYKCTATNPYGSVDHEIKLTVKADPAVEQIPTKPRFSFPTKMRRWNLVKPVNSFLRLRCRASGLPNPNIEWYKDGNLTDEPSSKTVKQNRPTWVYTIRKAQLTDSGQYRCRVWNSAGEINFTYKVRIVDQLRERPTLLEPHPMDTTVHVGGMTTIQCRVQSRMKPTVKWIKRMDQNSIAAYGDDLPQKMITIEGRHYLILPTQEMLSLPNGSYLNKLVIRGATEKHAGMYICLAANTMGYNYKYAYLNVTSGPVNTSLRSTTPPRTRIGGQAQPGNSRRGSANKQGSLSLPAIIGAPAGIGLVMVAFLAWFCHRRREQALKNETANTVVVSGSDDRLSALGSSSVETKSTRSSPVPQECDPHQMEENNNRENTLGGVPERQNKHAESVYTRHHTSKSPPTAGTPLLTVNEPDDMDLQYHDLPTDDDTYAMPLAPPCSEAATSCYSFSEDKYRMRLGPPPPPPPSQRSTSSVSSYPDPAPPYPHHYHYMHPPGNARRHQHHHHARPTHYHYGY